MRTAHLILTYTDSGLTERVIRRMAYPDFDFYIHVDKKVDIKPYLYLTSLPNVFLIKNREDVRWAGYNTVKATFNCIKEIVATGINYNFINLLSGQDYPLKPAGELATFFKSNRGKEFLLYRDFKNDWKEGQLRYRKYYLSNYLFKGRFFLEKVINLFMPVRKPPYNMHPYGKSMFWMLSPEAALYVVNKVEKDSKLRNFFFFSWASDEFIFQTVLMNSPYKKKIINENYRYMDWSAGGAHPKVLGVSDFKKIENSQMLFGRKFDASKDKKIMDLIDSGMLIWLTSLV